MFLGATTVMSLAPQPYVNQAWDKFRQTTILLRNPPTGTSGQATEQPSRKVAEPEATETGSRWNPLMYFWN